MLLYTKDDGLRTVSFIQNNGGTAMKKRILSFLLVLVMMVTMIPALDLHASASNAYVINEKTIHWDDITSKKSDCWNYANYFYNKVWGHRFNNRFDSSENCLRNLSDGELLLTPQNLKTFVTYAKLGSVLRVCDAEYLHGGDGWGHSVFIVDKDENGFTMFEGGLTNYPHCREKYYTWDKFVEVKGYQYIKYIKWPSAEAYVPCVHKYTDVGVCTSTCKKPFDFMGTKDNLVAGTYKITLKGGVYPRTDRPYGASTNKADLIPEGAEVTVEYGVKNHYGNRWFFVAYKGIKGYVSADNMVLVAHDCNHGKFKWKWTAHPHYNCYECSLCGEIVADTNEPTYNKNCQTCVDNHVHDKGQFKWSWTDHPHYNCYECTVCGEIVADTSEPTYKSSCGTCTETHKHDHGKFKWKWTAHPHYNCYECSGCGEIVADTNEPTFRADCQTCLESHEHDHGKFKWKWTAHPHYNCYECSLCGEIVADTNEPTFRADCESCTNTEKPCQHRYDFTITQEPALTQGGTYTAACITCGEFTNCDLPMLNTKDYAYTRTAEASCENNGREEYRWTDDFGADFLFEVYSPATGHSAELQNTKTAACTTDGYTGDEVCTLCGKTLKQGEIIKAAGHKWDNGKVIKQPTETNEGIQRFTCSVCTETEDTSIPAIDHKHSFTETVIEPTCTEDGYTLHECLCGENYKDNYIDAVDHDTVLKNAKPPRCTTDGYTGDEVCTLCGKTVKSGESIKAKGHSFSNGKCAICGTADPNYKEPSPTPAENPFTDVKNGDWFYTPVLWAVQNGVTGGTSPTTFSPDAFCTRAQVVTFLWAANGKPEPTTMNTPFTDVSNTAWYRKAVMWAVEQGISGGTSPTTFSPDAYCTRAQVATFLYAAQGKPPVKNTSNEFIDVPHDAWYLNPVLWAAENGITGGIGGGKFGPDQTCTRAQIATFLYKAMS